MTKKKKKNLTKTFKREKERRDRGIYREIEREREGEREGEIYRGRGEGEIYKGRGEKKIVVFLKYFFKPYIFFLELKDHMLSKHY